MSDAVAPLSWRVVPAALRTLARWITIVQLVGYTTSLVYVWHTTRLTPPGALRNCAGGFTCQGLSASASVRRRARVPVLLSV